MSTLTLYDVLLFAHVAAAIVWIGGSVSVQLLALRAERARDESGLERAVADLEWLTLRLFVPVSWLALGFGVGLVLEGPWQLSAVWIVIGLSGFAASVVLGMLLVAAQLGVLRALRGNGDSLLAPTRRLFVLARLELGLLLAIVLDMTLKPTTAEESVPLAAGTLIAFSAVLALHRLGARPAEDVPEAFPVLAD